MGDVNKMVLLPIAQYNSWKEKIEGMEIEKKEKTDILEDDSSNNLEVISSNNPKSIPEENIKKNMEKDNEMVGGGNNDITSDVIHEKPDSLRMQDRIVLLFFNKTKRLRVEKILNKIQHEKNMFTWDQNGTIIVGGKKMKKAHISDVLKFIIDPNFFYKPKYLTKILDSLEKSGLNSKWLKKRISSKINSETKIFHAEKKWLKL